jgi:DNA-binding NtrC family response regulator
MQAKILAIDDEIGMLKLLERIIRTKTEYQILTIAHPEEVAKIIEKEYFELVLLDLRMPNLNGLEVLKQIKTKEPDTSIIIITAYGTIDSAVEAMKIGAFDFITKPFHQEQILLTIHRAMEVQSLKRENRILKEELGQKKNFDFVIGKSPLMQSIYCYILQIAKSMAPVVITGETGTGKEVVARAVHRHSQRKGPFVVVNCSVIPETLIESELFGHIKGAFSGAIRDKKGLVEEANEGTILLDEVGDLNTHIQIKLLRFLQEGEFKPLGSNKIKRADVRIVVATNKNLEEMVKQGNFRQDLYYRINVIHIYLPSLEERKEDIPLLAHYFLEKYTAAYNKQIRGLSSVAMKRLLTRRWPGNVRELENVIERAVILCQDEYIGTKDIDLKGSLKDQSPFFDEVFPLSFKRAKKEILLDFYQRYLSYILAKCGGNVSVAAQRCGVKRQYFYHLLKLANIKPSVFKH